MVATIAALTLGGGTVAQAPATLPLDPSDPTRCGAWSAAPDGAPAGGRAGGAIAVVQGVPFAVDAAPADPTCNLPRREMSSLGSSLGDRILELDREAGVFDAVDQQVD